MREEQPELSMEKQASRSMVDLLTLPDEAQTIITWLMRRGEAALSELAALIEQDEAATRSLLAQLVAQGFVQDIDGESERHPRYSARLAAKRTRKLDLDL
jgi:DNA-binding MarR family transcriptional regulator